MKIVKILSALALSTGMLFVSCKKDSATPADTTTPVTNNPTISLVGGSGYTTADFTTTVGSPDIRIKTISLTNSTSGSKLDNMYITSTSNNVITYSNTTTFPSSTTSHNDSLVIPTLTAGTMRVEFKVTDKAGLTAMVGINITIVAAAPAVAAIGAGNITLGGASDASPSYVNLQTGTTYSAAAATANAMNIQLVYNKTKLLSPNDATVSNTAVQTSGVITKLAVYTAKAYSAITAADIAAYIISGTATNVTIANGSVVMFQTSTGKKGVLQIVTFNGSATSTTMDNITFAGQVQQ